MMNQTLVNIILSAKPGYNCCVTRKYAVPLIAKIILYGRSTFCEFVQYISLQNQLVNWTFNFMTLNILNPTQTIPSLHAITMKNSIP